MPKEKKKCRIEGCENMAKSKGKHGGTTTYGTICAKCKKKQKMSCGDPKCKACSIGGVVAIEHHFLQPVVSQSPGQDTANKVSLKK